MDRRQRLIEIFDDTQRFYAQNAALAKALQDARKATKLYEADDYPAITKQADLEGTVAVSKHKTFEAAMLIHKEHPDWKIAVLNFASATNPGGKSMSLFNPVSNPEPELALAVLLSEES